MQLAITVMDSTPAPVAASLPQFPEFRPWILELLIKDGFRRGSYMKLRQKFYVDRSSIGSQTSIEMDTDYFKKKFTLDPTASFALLEEVKREIPTNVLAQVGRASRGTAVRSHRKQTCFATRVARGAVVMQQKFPLGFDYGGLDRKEKDGQKVFPYTRFIAERMRRDPKIRLEVVYHEEVTHPGFRFSPPDDTVYLRDDSRTGFIKTPGNEFARQFLLNTFQGELGTRHIQRLAVEEELFEVVLVMEKETMYMYVEDGYTGEALLEIELDPRTIAVEGVTD